MSASNRLPSPEPENPFDDLDEGTRNLIWDLLHEKDEARQNYTEETKKTQCLEAQLEAAQIDQAIIRAQLTTTESRVAGKFFIMKQFFFNALPISTPNPFFLQSWNR